MSKKDKKTLCALEKQGFIKSNTDDFIQLIRPAAYFCRGCGRSAVNEERLCKPRKL